MSRTLMTAALFVTALVAQRNTASLAGQIRDVSKGVVPGAKVTVLDAARNVERSTMSNPEGYYVIPALPAGAYSLAVTASGFQSHNVSNVTLQVDQQATVDVELKVGTLSESVTVEANTATVDTRTATLNTVVNQTMITDPPAQR